MPMRRSSTCGLGAVALLAASFGLKPAVPSDCMHDRAKKMWCASAVPLCPASVTPPDQCSYSPSLNTTSRSQESGEPPPPAVAVCYELFHCIGVVACSLDLNHPVAGGTYYAAVNVTIDCDP